MSDRPNSLRAGAEIRANSPAAHREAEPATIGGTPLSAQDLITLNEEIAAMAKAGLPLDQGLRALATEMGGGRLRQVTAQLAGDLAAGFPLPDAIRRQSARLPGYYAALLTAGIRSNRLNEVLASVTVHARQQADFRDEIRGALIYPTMVLIMGFILNGFVAIYLVPRFVDIFRGFRMQVPWATQAVFFLSDYAIGFFVVPPIVIVVGLLLQRWILQSSKMGRLMWARFAYAVPIVGTMSRSARLAVFADLLAILVDQSVPLIEGLPLAAEASGDPLLLEGVRVVEAELREGVALSKALDRQRLVPDLVVWMIGYGERSGKLGETLHQLALMYRRKAEVRAAFLRVVLPPFLIIFVAFTMSGMLVLGLMGPLYQLLAGLSGG